jgi:hypothetical protein
MAFSRRISTIMRIGYLHQQNSIFVDFGIVAKKPPCKQQYDEALNLDGKRPNSPYGWTRAS